MSRVHTACLQHGLLKLWIQSFIVLPHSALPLFSKFKSEFSSLFLTCLRRSCFPEGGQNTELLICFRALIPHCLLSRGLQEQYWLASGAAQGSRSGGRGWGVKGMLTLPDRNTRTHTINRAWLTMNISPWVAVALKPSDNGKSLI